MRRSGLIETFSTFAFGLWYCGPQRRGGKMSLWSLHSAGHSHGGQHAAWRRVG